MRKLNASTKRQLKIEVKGKIKQQKQQEKFIKSQQFIMTVSEPQSYIIALENKLYTISINEEGVEVLEMITQQEVKNETLLITLLKEVNKKHG